MIHISVNEKKRVINFMRGSTAIYWIDLDELTSSAELLDFIFQIRDKTWMTAALMFEFLKVMDDMCFEFFDMSVQGTFCAWGKDHRVDFRTGKSEPLKGAGK